MEKFNRQVRRSHYRRLKRNRKNYSHRRHNNSHINTPCACSCFLCCNERTNGNKTLNELRNKSVYEEEIQEIKM